MTLSYVNFRRAASPCATFSNMPSSYMTLLDLFAYRNPHISSSRYPATVKMKRNDAENREPLIIAITTIVLVLGYTSYILRLYIRSTSNAKLWYDDYMMGVGLVSRFPKVYSQVKQTQQSRTNHHVVSCDNSLHL